MQARGPSAYVAEFLGTMVLVLAIGTIVSLHQVGPLGLGYQDWAVIGLVHVFVLALLVASLGPVSGGHFNPAVTLAMAIVRRVHARDAAAYVVLQVAGAVVGALLVKALLGDVGRAAGYGAPHVSQTFLGGSAGRGLLAELMGSFLLVWAYLAAGTEAIGRAPLIVGGTLGLGVMLFGPLTGAALNPARAFGPALVGSAFGETGTWLAAYLAGPVAGALLAAGAYRALQARS